MPSGGEEAVAPRVRSWCEHCVKGRGRASPHAIVSEGVLPEVGVDYA